MRGLLVVAIATVAALASTPLCIGQETLQPASKAFLPQQLKPANCESNIAKLDTASNLAGKDSLIIVIAHQGLAEKKGNLNHRRLSNVRTYLTQFAKKEATDIVLGEGEPINGLGEIRLYIKGLLFSSISIGRDFDLAVGQCSYEGQPRCSVITEKDFFPCRR